MKTRMPPEHGINSWSKWSLNLKSVTKYRYNGPQEPTTVHPNLELCFVLGRFRVQISAQGLRDVSGVQSAGWLDIHFTAGASCERAAPLAEKNVAARHHVLRSLISLHSEHRVDLHCSPWSLQINDETVPYFMLQPFPPSFKFIIP
jgi:hypothetical protein